MNNFSTSNTVVSTDHNQSSSKYNHSRENSKLYYDESRLFSDIDSKSSNKRKSSLLDFSIDNFKAKSN